MTAKELQDKFHETIILNGYEIKPAAKQCALITIEHTIGVLESLKFEPTINYSESISIDMANVATKHFNAHIDRKISELQKQKEQL